MVTLSCEEVQKRFDVFLDGETDGRSMRELALHLTRCPSCEEEFRAYELADELSGGSIENAVDRIDVPELWHRIESRLEPLRASVWERLRERWDSRPGVGFGPSVLAIVAAVLLLAIGLSLWSGGPREAPSPRAGNEAHIERIASSRPNVVVWTEPEQHTTAIWVASYEP